MTDYEIIRRATRDGINDAFSFGPLTPGLKKIIDWVVIPALWLAVVGILVDIVTIFINT